MSVQSTGPDTGTNPIPPQSVPAIQSEHLQVSPSHAQPPAVQIRASVPRPTIRRESSFVRELIETVLLIAAIYAFVNLATARFVVDGHSMLPNFNNDQFIIVSRLSYILGEPQRGDVVVFHYPLQDDRDFIKRIIGLPGEKVTILESKVYINDKLIEEPYIENWCRGKSCDGEWIIGDDEFFVLGDNRGASKDSQDFGPVGREYLVGRAFVRYWPPSEWGIIDHWKYGQNGAPLPTVTPTYTPTHTSTPLPDWMLDQITPTPTEFPYESGWYGGSDG